MNHQLGRALLFILISSFTFFDNALASVDRPVKSLIDTSIYCSPSSKSISVANIKAGITLYVCTQCDSPQEVKDKQGQIWQRIFWDSSDNSINLNGWVLKKYLKDLPY